MRILKRKFSLLLAALLLAALPCGCGAREASAAPEQISESSISVPAATPAVTPPPVQETEAPPAPPAPTAAPEPTAEPTPEPTPTRVEDSFFADAAFFGNSLVDGLHSFGGLEYGDFFAGTSASVLSVNTTKDARLSDGTAATMLDALLEKQYGRIYVLLGINELGFNRDGFVELYAELLGTIAAAEPDAELIVMSLTPITQKRSNSEDLFTREKILDFNTAIRAMVEERGYTYMDLYAAFADANGWLPPESSTDGVHFTAALYSAWAEYLRTHPAGDC